MNPPGSYRLLADIGGTNARFALQTPGALVRSVQGEPIRHAAIAIATAVDGDLVGMTNHHWTFSIAALRTHLDLATLLVVNDFIALAMSMPRLASDQRRKIGGGLEQPGKPIGLLGPGTGLGVSGLVPAGERSVALASEGGHATFAPADITEMGVLQYLWSEYGHVSAERLLSGMGLELIHRALSGETLCMPRRANGSGCSPAASAANCARIDVMNALASKVRPACPVPWSGAALTRH